MKGRDSDRGANLNLANVSGCVCVRRIFMVTHILVSAPHNMSFKYLLYYTVAYFKQGFIITFLIQRK